MVEKKKSLLSLKSDLRTLKYSHFGGDTPLINQNLPDYSSKGKDSNAITARATDLVRVSKLLASKNGLNFAGNLALLQQSNVESKIRRASKGEKLSVLKNQIVPTLTGIAKVIGSTIAQVPVSGTGLHFIWGFDSNSYLKPGGSQNKPLGLLGKVSDFLGMTDNVNAASIAKEGGTVPTGIRESNLELVEFKPDLYIKTNQYSDEEILTSEVNVFSPTVVRGSSIKTGFSLLETDTPRNLPTSQSLEGEFFSDVHNYDGSSDYKPNPNTKILRTIQRDVTQNFEEDVNVGLMSEFEQTLEEYFSPAVLGSLGIPEQFLYRIAKDQTNQNDVREPKYTVDKANIEIRLGLSNNLKQGTIERSDIFQFSLERNPLDEPEIKELVQQDMIPFYFNILSPDYQRVIFFRAYLDRLSDSFQGQWQGTRYLGRSEEMFTYTGFGRTVAFDFKVAAFRRDDLIPLYRKLNALAGTTAPSYGIGGEFMRGTLTSLTVGDYFKQQMGIVTGVDFSWEINYPWEIGDLEGQNTGIIRVPHVLGISVRFTPIHNFNVQWNELGYFGGL